MRHYGQELEFLGLLCPRDTVQFHLRLQHSDYIEFRQLSMKKHRILLGSLPGKSPMRLPRKEDRIRSQGLSLPVGSVCSVDAPLSTSSTTLSVLDSIS